MRSENRKGRWKSWKRSRVCRGTKRGTRNMKLIRIKDITGHSLKRNEGDKMRSKGEEEEE